MKIIQNLFQILILKNKQIFRGILAVCMIVAGLLHFVFPEPFIKIVPNLLPYPGALVYLSGSLEIIAGISLLIPTVSQIAAWGLVLLFIAVYPANINMAVNHIQIANIPDSNWFQAIRLPFQFVLIAWAWWLTRPDNHSDRLSTSN
ncbi:DoxX family protein [Pleurocapsa sp. PCC 7319]|uniref:DoxX family protein n=1 Tax=Pleurocapsa sp. PCC 7319 TaxID=118161 RepID=UPI000366588A|nr:DoxX family protein [Pleurocapsa sp. PCC 7319]